MLSERTGKGKACAEVAAAVWTMRDNGRGQGGESRREEKGGGKEMGLFCRPAAARWIFFASYFVKKNKLKKAMWEPEAGRANTYWFVCVRRGPANPPNLSAVSFTAYWCQTGNQCSLLCVRVLSPDTTGQQGLSSRGRVWACVWVCVCVCVFAWGEVCYLPTGQKWSEAKQCQVRKAVALSFPLCCCFLSLNQCVPAFIPSSQSVSLQPYPKQEAVTWRRYNQSQCRSLHTSPCQRPNSRLTEDNNV